MIRKILTFVIIVLAIFTVGLAVIQRQYVRDWLIVQTTDVQPAAATLASNIYLTESGSFLYKASRPEVLGSEPFNAACGNVAREQSIVLGCYTAQRFYMYDVKDARLSGVQEVTAAHELLHAAYERLSADERFELNQQLQIAASAIQDERFKATLAEYTKTEPAEIDNEIHSILGTEVAVLPEALEKHYAQYFKDRQKLVSYSDAYQQQFRTNEAQRTTYEQQLAVLKTQIDSEGVTIKQLESEITRMQQRMNALRQSDVEEYNTLVAPFNALVKKYNTAVTTAISLTETYNNTVKAINELASTQTELTQLLDSNYQTR